MVVQAEGYVSDVPYVRVFIPHLAPACTGSFDGIQAGFKGANLYNGRFDVKTP
jgi:hypothetical protein